MRSGNAGRNLHNPVSSVPETASGDHALGFAVTGKAGILVDTHPMPSFNPLRNHRGKTQGWETLYLLGRPFDHAMTLLHDPPYNREGKTVLIELRLSSVILCEERVG